MNNYAELNTAFRFLDSQLLVNRVRWSPVILLAHIAAFSRGAVARLNVKRVELKTFTFSGGSQSLSIQNAELGPLPKRLLFTMVKKSDLLSSVTTKPYNLCHYDISDFVLHVNGRQIPAEGLSLGMDHDKTSVMGYRTLFEGRASTTRTRDSR